MIRFTFEAAQLVFDQNHKVIESAGKTREILLLNLRKKLAGSFLIFRIDDHIRLFFGIDGNFVLFI